MNELDALLVPALRTLRTGGLNRWGVVGVTTYDAVAGDGLRGADLAPWAQSILVFASGGRALWDGMIAAMEADSGRLTQEAHPLDAHVERLISGVSMGEVQHRWFLATATAPVQLDFRTLAVLSGVGAPSRLGLVMDGEVGPWMGMRAACFIDRVLPASTPAPDQCEGCPAPCIPACPAGALQAGQWNVGICADYHQSSEDCAHTCHSRLACPVGEEHRYSALQRAYHYNRAAGRRALRESLGLRPEEDPHEGIGPHWGDWVDPSS